MGSVMLYGLECKAVYKKMVQKMKMLRMCAVCDVRQLWIKLLWRRISWEVMSYERNDSEVVRNVMKVSV